MSELQLIISLLSKQRHKHHRSVDTSGACVPLLVATAATTSVAALAYFDLNPVAFRQSTKFYKPGFSGKSLATVTAVGRYATLGGRRDCTVAAVAASAIVTAVAVHPFDRVAVHQAGTSATVATIAAGCRMDLLSNPNGCFSTTAATTAASRRKKIQALNTERPATAASPASRANNNGEAV